MLDTELSSIPGAEKGRANPRLELCVVAGHALLLCISRRRSSAKLERMLVER